MSFLRRHLPWSLALLLSFATTVSAEPLASDTQSSDQAVCSSEEQSDANASEAELSAGLLCLSTRCLSEEDCWNACPGAISVACVSNACKYTYSTGGGGGGGPYCPATRCIDDSDCICQGQQGYCSNRACTY